MRKLAGTTWGADLNLLNRVYQGAIRPHLEYGSSAWSTAAKSHQQKLDRVQNQALRIITGAMRSTPIDKMEHLTGIVPLSKRRDSKLMIQATKFKSLPQHPMNKRMNDYPCNKLKRTSFQKQSKSLLRQHKGQLPDKIHQVNTVSCIPPWERQLDNVKICTGVQHLTPGEEHSEPYKRALTLAMIDEQYPEISWTQVYTDGSARNAVENGGAGIHIMDPSGYREEAHFHTGKHCTNYAAEVEAPERRTAYMLSS